MSDNTTSNDLPVTRHTIFQNSLMTALLDGIYDGEMSVGELLGKGNFGLGTFDALDGEMVIVDGVCYQLRHDGTATRARLSARSPYAVATNFVPRIRRRAPENIRRADLSNFIDEMTPSANYMYAVRITGRFSKVTTRTVVRQQKPYPRMTEAVGDDAEQNFTDVSGVIAGFRTPIFEKGISVPGCHVHFIDDDRTQGGHVLDFTLAEGKIELCPGTDLDLRLPLTSAFSDANLDPEDLDEELHVTEVKGD
ncbi:MAG: acetolactate decarboxylase [Corynebacterium sp.]|uniref:acetolactate decarboxylase n=1 Tax=Corynebacterium TaxID=1716 RepID=UPI002649B576|nr:acetolactate decarboxylase [Corynebacterium sp.]MDN5721400.1 acetolactate decarboxylase [Corynebacterium sp.]MDN6281681.1 acetolactate decarboxylase [Corynebacterium sp.]MDN6304535.1 acetolactate decarboxylase [Corynebacterium sp.]MDN6351716.1 acetolactate decarboxylase [Corynebacterium sp.]MDN6366260.1 acetolactate decarboxylase [Corynebacterium sp.]